MSNYILVSHSVPTQFTCIDTAAQAFIDTVRKGENGYELDASITAQDVKNELLANGVYSFNELAEDCRPTPTVIFIRDDALSVDDYYNKAVAYFKPNDSMIESFTTNRNNSLNDNKMRVGDIVQTRDGSCGRITTIQNDHIQVRLDVDSNDGGWMFNTMDGVRTSFSGTCGKVFSRHDCGDVIEKVLAPYWTFMTTKRGGKARQGVLITLPTKVWQLQK